jgi:hypothetical protein
MIFQRNTPSGKRQKTGVPCLNDSPVGLFYLVQGLPIWFSRSACAFLKAASILVVLLIAASK